MDNNNYGRKNVKPGRAATVDIDPVALPDLIEAPHIRAGLKLVEQAVRNQWHIPDVVYRQLGKRIARILKTGSPREQIAAARVLVAMSASNDRQQIQKHQHVHAIIPAPHESELDAIKREGFERLARLRNHG